MEIFNNDFIEDNKNKNIIEWFWILDKKTQTIFIMQKDFIANPNAFWDYSNDDKDFWQYTLTTKIEDYLENYIFVSSYEVCFSILFNVKDIPYYNCDEDHPMFEWNKENCEIVKITLEKNPNNYNWFSIPWDINFSIKNIEPYNFKFKFWKTIEEERIGFAIYTIKNKLKKEHSISYNYKELTKQLEDIEKKWHSSEHVISYSHYFQLWEYNYFTS